MSSTEALTNCEPSNPLILVVDDHDSWRDLVVARLRRLGATTCEATNIAGAVTLLERTPVDLVVTDHRMPGGSGLDLLLIARERAPSVPVVLVSASVSDELARAAVD